MTWRRAIAFIPANPLRSTATRRAHASITGSRRGASCFWRLSGLALFHPRLFFLTGLFGGGPLTRIIHPWIGVLLFFSFFGLFLRFWKANLWKREDGTWLARIRDVLTGHEERLPDVGKYNAGQKFVFWSMSALIIVLITTGLIIWDQYFSSFHHNRAEAMGRARAFDRGYSGNQCVDHPCLRSDLGTWYNKGNDPWFRDWRLGVEASSQMVARAGRKSIKRQIGENARRITGR